MASAQSIYALVEEEARRQGVNPRLAVLVARRESNSKVDALSPKGAVGIMQLMPQTAQSLGVNPYDPLENIQGGVRYLKMMQEQFPDRPDLQLAAYNAGPGAVKKYGGVPPYKETQGYVSTILGALSPREAQADTLETAQQRAADRLEALQRYEAARQRLQALEDFAEKTKASPAKQLGVAVARQLPTVGSAAGTYLGAKGGQASAVMGGALGAAVGKAAEIALTQNRLPTWQELETEAGDTAVLDVATRGIAGVIEKTPPLMKKAVGALARGTPGGLVLRKEEAAEIARGGAQAIFQPFAKERIDEMFALVRNSGLAIDATPLGEFFKGIGRGKTSDLLQDVAHFDTVNRTGGRFTKMVKKMVAYNTKKGKAEGIAFDIGDLQDLRSKVRQLTETAAVQNSFESQKLLNQFREIIDFTIDEGGAVGNNAIAYAEGEIPAVLREARRQYARYRAAEDFHAFIESHIRMTPDLTLPQLMPGNLERELRANRTGVAQAINRSLDKTPGAREQMERLLKELGAQFSTIELGMADTSGLRREPKIAMLSQLLSTVLLSEKGRALLRDTIIRKPGTTVGVLPVNLLAVLANAVRRETLRPAAADVPQVSVGNGPLDAPIQVTGTSPTGRQLGTGALPE